MTTRLGRIETIDDPRPVISELTADEIKRLKGGIERPEWLEFLQTAALAGGCFGVLVYAVLGLLLVLVFWLWDVEVSVGDRFGGHITAAGVIVGLCVFGRVLRDVSGSDHGRKRRAELERDIAGASAHTIEFDLKRVVEIEEYEDEGTGFFLETTDGRVLCLISQDFYEYASDVELEKNEEDRRSQFPQTRIRYRYAPHSGTCLDLAGCGEPLRPFGKVKTTRRFFKKDKTTGRRFYTGPEDGVIYDGPIEATLHAFGYGLETP